MVIKNKINITVYKLLPWHVIRRILFRFLIQLYYNISMSMSLMINTIVVNQIPIIIILSCPARKKERNKEINNSTTLWIWDSNCFNCLVVAFLVLYAIEFSLEIATMFVFFGTKVLFFSYPADGILFNGANKKFVFPPNPLNDFSLTWLWTIKRDFLFWFKRRKS